VTFGFLTMTGAGGAGGSGRRSGGDQAGGAGGGAGEYTIKQPLRFDGSPISYSVGIAGVVGALQTNGGNGGDTSFGIFIALGGQGGQGNALGGNLSGGAGGGPGGGPSVLGQIGVVGAMEQRGFCGGASGGGWNNSGNVANTRGGPAPGVGYTPANSAAVVKAPGGGGGASIWGVGGLGGDAILSSPTNWVGYNGVNYGSGGGGGGATTAGATTNSGLGGAGAPGYIMVTYYGPV